VSAGLLSSGPGSYPGYQPQQAPAPAAASLFSYQQQPQAQGMSGVPQFGGYQVPGGMGGYTGGMPGMAAPPAGGLLLALGALQGGHRP